MAPRPFWKVVYYALWLVFVLTAALNMLHVRGGFLTNHAADITGPALLYVIFRGLHTPRARRTRLQRWLGRSPEVAALSLFIASATTEVSSYFWPRGLFPGRFDPLDFLAYAAGLAACYAADRILGDNQP